MPVIQCKELDKQNKRVMAKVKESIKKLEKKKVSRPGIHAKCKTSKLKSSKNYKKIYKGQG
jgi:hypothetical protein